MQSSAKDTREAVKMKCNHQVDAVKEPEARRAAMARKRLRLITEFDKRRSEIQSFFEHLSQIVISVQESAYLHICNDALKLAVRNVSPSFFGDGTHVVTL